MIEDKANTQHKFYSPPKIERIILDAEISLVLDSMIPDPGDPGMSANKPEYFNNDPFGSKLG